MLFSPASFGPLALCTPHQRAPSPPSLPPYALQRLCDYRVDLVRHLVRAAGPPEVDHDVDPE